MKDNYDVIVVGAGPAGSIAAKTIAELGLDVLVLEKRQEIGSPVRCAEGISSQILHKFFAKLKPEWISQEIHGGRIFSPNETPVVLNVPNAGYVLERKIFDRGLAEQAALAGAEILVKARVTNVLKNNGKVDGVIFRHFKKEYSIQSKVVIAADGIESQIGRWAGIDSTHKPQDIDTCAQYIMANIDIKPYYCDFYLGQEVAPRGYAWIFPKGENIANVGLGIGGNISDTNGKLAINYLNRFVSRKFPNGSILAQIAGCVPVGGSLEKFVADGIMLVGDAAHHGDPISGGGIANAMISGKIAAEVAVKGIRQNNLSAELFSEYPKRWYEEVEKDFKHLRHIRENVLKFPDELLDKCAEGLSKLPSEEVTLVKVFTTVLRHKPSLLLSLSHLITSGWFS